MRTNCMFILLMIPLINTLFLLLFSVISRLGSVNTRAVKMLFLNVKVTAFHMVNVWALGVAVLYGAAEKKASISLSLVRSVFGSARVDYKSYFLLELLIILMIYCLVILFIMFLLLG